MDIVMVTVGITGRYKVPILRGLYYDVLKI
jgi:hypothetical protein